MTGPASLRSARRRRAPSRPTLPIGSLTGNVRDPYVAQAPDSRPQVQGADRRRGAVPGARHAERGAVQPPVDRPWRGGVLYDVDGNRYIQLLAGVAVAGLG